jgi:alginate O-acetyltransferase complex protein AlgI
MLFNSLTFIAFFALVMVAHQLPISWTAKKRNLLVASYVFYAAWNPPFIVLVWLSTVTDWFVARGIAASKVASTRRALLLTSLGVNLGLLAYFKYAGFMLDNFVWTLSLLGIVYRPPELDIILPLGISFYTFQTLSYTISVYRNEMRPAKSFLDYALFVTFFPQLVAGPIVRAQEFLPQCLAPKRADARQLGWGLCLLVFGLFQKVVLADALLAPAADLVFGATSRAGALDAWTGTLAFSCQIFFDFAGYSSCAIGAGMCLGFVLPENFRFPYAASGFSDFWRRWHISLSSWLRDYLYIPLGGNRRGRSRTYVNLMITMLLGGLWHGAAWHFVVWGALHGAYLAIERMVREKLGGPSRVRGAFRQHMACVGTFLVVSVTWVFFRAENIQGALQLLDVMLSGRASPLVGGLQCAGVTMIVVCTVFVHILLRDADLEDRVRRVPLWLRATVLALMLCSLMLSPGDDRAFIYFQF